MSKKYIAIGIIVAFVVLLATASVGSCFSDNAEYHWDIDGDGFGDADDLSDLWVVESYTSEDCDLYDPINIHGTNYTKVFGPRARFKETYPEDTQHVTLVAYNRESSASNWWSFTLRDWAIARGSKQLKLYFYNASGYEINNIEITSYMVKNTTYEMLVVDEVGYFYADGVEKLNFECTETPNYLKFYMRLQGPSYDIDDYYTVYMYIDDITNEKGVVGIGHEKNYGFNKHNTNEMADNEIDVEYTLKTLPPSQCADSTYKYKVTKFTTGAIINETTLSINNRTGYFIYNRSELIGLDYGMYLFWTEKDGVLEASDYLLMNKVGENSYVVFDEDKYYATQPAQMSYHIDPSDFINNYYYLKLYSGYGELKETWALTTADGTEEWDTTDYDTGLYYIILISSDKDTGVTEELALDIASLVQEFRVTGITYDAQTGAILSNVSINFTQSSLDFDTVSNATGHYNLSGFYIDLPVEITASKSNYTHENFTASFPKYQEYTIDLYLLNTTPFYSGSGIGGIVTQYPFHQAIENATVTIKNATGWNDSTTTTATGFYLFDDLELDNTTITNESFNTSAYESWVSLAHSAVINNTETVYNTTIITNETFNSSAYDTWVSLYNSSIVSDTQLVSNTTDETPYTNNTDYEMNYTNGTIKVLSTGNMSNYTDYHIDYNYTRFFNKTIDYEMNYTDGKIKTLESGNLSNYTNYSIDYTYEIATTFVLQASADDHTPSDDTNVTANPNDWTTQNFLLSPSFTLTVYIRDLTSHATIYTFDAICEGEQKDSTTGNVSFYLDYGIHRVTVNAEGYYSNYKDIYMDSDKEDVIYLTKFLEAGGAYYSVPVVQFTILRNLWLTPYADVNVTVQGYDTTMDNWDWLYGLFGVDYENYPLQNVTMAGTTDSTGSISFAMIGTIKYKMTFIKESDGINETIYLYPKEDHYKIIIGTRWVETKSQWDVVNYSVLVDDIPGNDTHSYINFSYVDGNNATSEVYYFINQTNGTTSFNIYNHTYTSGDCADITNSYIVKRGEAYLIGFVGANDDFGEIKYSVLIRIFEKSKRLLEFEGAPDYIYTYVSIGLLMLVAAFFGMVTIPEGGIVICLEAWILFFLGWFLFENPLAPLYLTVATVFAILIIFAEKGRQKGVS